MRTKIQILLVVVAAVAAFVLGRLDNADAQTTIQPRIVWEYRDGANLNSNQLNALGAEGWELCSMTTYGTNLYYVFKRAK